MNWIRNVATGRNDNNAKNRAFDAAAASCTVRRITRVLCVYRAVVSASVPSIARICIAYLYVFVCRDRKVAKSIYVYISASA